MGCSDIFRDDASVIASVNGANGIAVPDQQRRNIKNISRGSGLYP
jgi:hypothetical protein